MRAALGFTLVELLVVIAIVAILAVVGIVIFSNVQKGARDAKRKADINAIAKAYEAHYDSSVGQYPAIADSWFTQGVKPKDPDGVTDYTYMTSSPTTYRVCVPLEANSGSSCTSPSTNCYCKTAQQGPGAPPPGGGGFIDFPPSCDPNGTLSNGLIAYWKMDEPSWNGTSGEVIDLVGGHSGTAVGGATTTAGKFGNAGSFNGTTGYVLVGNTLNMGTSSFSLSAWIKKPSNASDGKFEEWILGKKLNAASSGYTFDVKGSLSTPSGRLGARYSDGGSVYGVTTTSLVDDNAWHHVVLNFDRSASNRVSSLYIDGSFSISSSNSSITRSLDNSDNFLIAMVDWNTGSKFNGLIDNVQVYNRVLMVGTP